MTFTTAARTSAGIIRQTRALYRWAALSYFALS
jgi:hypothetical protein